MNLISSFESIEVRNKFEISAVPLFLRPILETDLDEIHAIWTNEQVKKYLFDDEVISTETALEEIKTSGLSFEQNKHGLWGVFFKDSPKMIGFTGYRNFHDPPELQLLYGLLPEYFGKGYATTLAKVMIKYGFEELDFEEIIACADVPNVASLKVMQKAGMKFDKQIEIGGSDLIYYKIVREGFKPDL